MDTYIHTWWLIRSIAMRVISVLKKLVQQGFSCRNHQPNVLFEIPDISAAAWWRPQQAAETFISKKTFGWWFPQETPEWLPCARFSRIIWSSETTNCAIIYIYIWECLFVCLFAVNAKTTERIDSKAHSKFMYIQACLASSIIICMYALHVIWSTFTLWPWAWPYFSCPTLCNQQSWH